MKRLIAMNLDLERLLVGHGDDIYEGAKDNMARIFAGTAGLAGKGMKFSLTPLFQEGNRKGVLRMADL